MTWLDMVSGCRCLDPPVQYTYNTDHSWNIGRCNPVTMKLNNGAMTLGISSCSHLVVFRPFFSRCSSTTHVFPSLGGLENSTMNGSTSTFHLDPWESTWIHGADPKEEMTKILWDAGRRICQMIAGSCQTLGYRWLGQGPGAVLRQVGGMVKGSEGLRDWMFDGFEGQILQEISGKQFCYMCVAVFSLDLAVF